MPSAQISIKPLNAGPEPPITPPFTPRPFAGLIHLTPWIGGEPGIKGGIEKMGEECKQCAAATQGQGEEALRHIHGEGERVMREIRQKKEGLGRAMQSMVGKK